MDGKLLSHTKGPEIIAMIPLCSPEQGLIRLS